MFVQTKSPLPTLAGAMRTRRRHPGCCGAQTVANPRRGDEDGQADPSEDTGVALPTLAGAMRTLVADESIGAPAFGCQPSQGR